MEYTKNTGLSYKCECDKINITQADYQCNGLGFNSYNFIKNVAPRISTWLLKECLFSDPSKATIEYHDWIAKKLEKIAEIIDE